MGKSPVQIVLNSNDFIEAWIKPAGGGNKDFYAGKDSEFVLHKQKISEELSNIKNLLTANEYSEISYAKVVLKPSAIAKSHRPTGVLFKHDIAPVIGAGDLGELFVEVSPNSIDKISYKIAQTEEETKYKENKKGEIKPNPSAARSELGAIDYIEPYNVSDKRRFSISEGLEWISNPQTGGAYIVELFEMPPAKHEWDNFTSEKYKLFKSFNDGLIKLGNGIVVSKVTDTDKYASMIGVKLEDSSNLPNIQFNLLKSSARKENSVQKIVKDLDKHLELIGFLDRHPLVKKIILPPIISKSKVRSGKVGKKYTLPELKVGEVYPKIGIIDGGVSSIYGDWIEDRWGLLSPVDRDEAHGTFIAGLAVFGKSLNGEDICKEIDGCKIIDLDLLPKEGVFANYYRAPLQFLNEMEDAIKSLKAKTGVRIFNFSLNIEEHVSSDRYSLTAKMLDKIAEENDVIFIISAGNTHRNDFRKEWPLDSSDALAILAGSRNDIIKTPAESCRNISVSALNPPNMKDIVPFALSNYSCRGPATRVGLKPDFAHVGGSGTRISDIGHGLLSIDNSGNIIDGCGTSYAAPNVAKTLASMDHSIEGDVSRETLLALTTHHAVLPEVLKDKKLKDIVKHLVGFGIPVGADEILAGSDHSITLVFANRLRANKKMSFSFAWPESLVKNNKCFGHARLTIVSSPPLDYRYGAEFVRVNVEGHLRQEQKDGSYKGRLESIYMPSESADDLYEKNQIANSFKWSPVKVFEKTFKGVGPSTNWKLEVDYLTRDGEAFPRGGVPFTALLTISDPSSEKPVFNEMRQSLQAIGVNIVDIKTAARIIPRV